MRCEQIRSDLTALIDGELHPMTDWRVRRHIARCTDCADEFAALRKLNARLLDADLFERDPLAAEARVNRPRRIDWQPVLAATAICLLLFFGFLFRHYPRAVRPVVARKPAAGETPRLAHNSVITTNRTNPAGHPVKEGVPAASRIVPPLVQDRFAPHTAFRNMQAGIRSLVAPVAKPAHDDLNDLNADPTTILAAWSRYRPDETESLKSSIDRTIRAGDDFVAVPWPMLATADATPEQQRTLYAAAIAAYRQQKEIVDARLVRKVSVAVKATAFSDLCRQLTEKTGIALSAGRSVMDEKITLLCEDQPLREIMRQINHVFGFSWSRSGEEGAYKYELIQDLRSQLAEEEMRNHDINAALVALDDKMTEYRPLLGLTPDKAREKAQNATDEDRKKLSVMGRETWGGVQIYHQLSPADRAALRNGEELEFSGAGSDLTRRLSADVAKPIVKAFPALHTSLDPEGASFNDRPEVTAFVKLKIDRSELGEVSLKADTRIQQVNPNGELGAGFGGESVLATAKSPSVADPDNATLNKDLNGQEPFKREVSIHPKPSCPLLAENGKKKPEELFNGVPGAFRFRPFETQPRDAIYRPHVVSADVWEEVHRQTGLPIIADSYMRLYDQKAVTVDKKSLFEALCKVGDGIGVRWKRDGDFIECRSASFFWDKIKEVPNRLIARWQQDSERSGGLPFEDLLELASLSDDQLDSLNVGDVMFHCRELTEWDLLQRPIGYYSPRPFLRMMTRMPAAQRQSLFDPKGAAYGDLPIIAQQDLVSILFKQFGKYAPRPQDLASNRYRVDYVPSGRYVWRPVVDGDKQGAANRMPVVSGRTAEEALAAARKIDPAAAADQILLMNGVFAVTQFDAKGNGWQIMGMRPVIYQRAPKPK